jgi:hypothetical protein
MGNLLNWARMDLMKNPDLKDASSLFRCAGARDSLHEEKINDFVL